MFRLVFAGLFQIFTVLLCYKTGVRKAYQKRRTHSMKTQRFGVEIELTGITRRDAAKLIADYFGTTSTYEGTGYNKYSALDRNGRKWTAMYDSSIDVP